MGNKKINYGFPKKIVTAFSFALLTVNFLVACSNKSGNHAPPPPVPIPCPAYGCQQAVGGQTLIVAPSISPLQGDWVLSGDPNLIAQQRMMNPVANIFNIYQGPLTLSGTIVAGDLASYSGSCAPLQSMVGMGFSFNTIAPGIAAYGSFEVPQVQASSGIGTFTFEVHKGILYMGKFSATLIVTSVNGVQCRSFPIAVF
jgi:hypothetical protein